MGALTKVITGVFRLGEEADSIEEKAVKFACSMWFSDTVVDGSNGVTAIFVT